MRFKNRKTWVFFEGAGRSSMAGLVTWLLLILTLAPSVLADEWDQDYEIGVQQLERGEWAAAVISFRSALVLKPFPDHQATTSNLKLVEYLPYYNLGQAYLMMADYEQALRSFMQSVQAGAINQTRHLRKLRQLQLIAEELYQSSISAAAGPSADQRQFEQLLNTFAASMVSDRLNDASRTLVQLKAVNAADDRLRLLEAWLQDEKRRAVIQAENESVQTQTQLEFQNGLDLFLTGQYAQALQAFQQAEQLQPGFAAAVGWRRKTETEIERLKLDALPPPEPVEMAPEIIERIVTQTTAPFFVITSPQDKATETRSSELVLSGRVGDDQGVDFLEFSVNGQTLSDSSGRRIQIRPSATQDSTQFSFLTTVPLRLGENQIVITAFDIDSPPHRTFEPYSVVRNKPVYKTAVFAITSGSFLLLVVGGVLLSRLIKYRIAIVNKYNPYIAGSPIRTEEMFFGREKLLRRIMNTVHNNSLMIYGPRRIGKTSLQHQLKLRLEKVRDPEYDFIPVMVDLQGTSEAFFFTTLMEEVIDSCRPRLNGDVKFRLHENKENYSGRDLSHDMKTLLKTLSEATSRKLKVVLLIDEVDELNKYSEQANQRLRSVFMKTFAENLVAVMSGAHIRKNWQSEGSPWYNFFEEIPVPPFEREDAIRLIREPVAGIFTYSDRAIEKIIDYSECKPYILQKFCVNVINWIIEHKRRRVTGDDVDAVVSQVLDSA